MSPKMLLVAPDFPYPPNHGARLDIWRRAQILKELGFDIDLLATVKSTPKEDDISGAKECFGRIQLCPIRPTITNAIGYRPVQLAMRKSLKHMPLEREYDIVFLESEFVVSVLENPQLRARHTVIRVHNNEAVYFLELARSGAGFFRSLYYYSEAAKFALMKPLQSDKLTNILFIADDEYQDFSVKNPGKNTLFLPPAMPIRSRTAPLASSKALFIGSLFMINNREAIDWYIHNVHDQLRDINGYELVVAGNTRNQRDGWIARLQQEPAVSFVDTPKELIPLYKDAGVFINPIIHGAGVKLKLIDALAHGLPVVSTGFGAKGSALSDWQHLYIADTPKDFAQAVRRALSYKGEAAAMVTEAQCFLQKFYDHKSRLGDFLDRILITGN